jgi:DNA processing protein
MSDQVERRAAVGLAALTGPTYRAAASIRTQGLVATWEHWRAQAVRVGRPVPDPERDLEIGQACGARFLLPGDVDWPGCLGDLEVNLDVSPPAEIRRAGRDHGVPFGLWVRGTGSLSELSGRSAAVVGARAATSYGTWVAGELALGLVERQATVISGGAFGIDAAAHRGALAGGGSTIAVLPGGIDIAYPQAHDTLLAAIAAGGGLLVAEQPPGRRPRRDGFLVRNRLIAALAGGVVLVEAGLRSGARNTFGHAAALSRPRMVVPGPVTSAMSAGCHVTFRLDPEARLITNAAEILEEVGVLGADLAPVPEGPPSRRDALGDDARAVLDAFPACETWTAGRIGAVLGLSLGHVLGLASALVDHGLLERDGPGFRLTALARAPAER